MAKPLISRQALVLAKKELYSYSYSPAMYGIGAFFLLFTSIWLFYLQNFFAQDTASLRSYFAAFPIAFILVIPVLTMRSWAEERKLGTAELLLTMPFSEWDLVLGKYLSSMGVLLTMLLLSAPLPLSVLPLGRFDVGIIVTEYAGVFLLGSSAVSIGLLLSCLSKNQGGAFIGTVVALLLVMLANQLSYSLNLPQYLASFFNSFSLSFHFESFAKGILDSRDGAFFILTTVIFLYLNTRVLVFRKWT
jgi:ABC-2 type transport system permease protein